MAVSEPGGQKETETWEVAGKKTGEEMPMPPRLRSTTLAFTAPPVPTAERERRTEAEPVEPAAEPDADRARNSRGRSETLRGSDG